MKKIFALLLVIAACFALSVCASAETMKHKVVQGDTMWKLSRKYGVELDDVIKANPQIENPDLIYPDQILNIPVKGLYITEYEQQVIDLVNKERAKNGLSALEADLELCRVARIKSEDMRDNKYFSHQSQTYGSPFDMLKNFGITYRAAGENIAMGQRTPAEVVSAWMNSSGHRANILNKAYTKIGVGYATPGNYWTQEFVG